MSAPEYDDHGDVEPHDHNEISNDNLLIRRINPEQHVVYDNNRGVNRISSAAFKPSSAAKGGMSIDLKHLIENDNKEPSEYVTTPIFTGSVEFQASVVRGVGLWVGYDPLDINPYHGEVWASAPRFNRFSDGQVKAIRRNAVWLVELPDVAIA